MFDVGDDWNIPLGGVTLLHKDLQLLLLQW